MGLTFKKFTRGVYAFIGATALASLVWATIEMVKHQFFNKMHFFGTAGFFILSIAGIILGVKSIFNKN